MREYRMVLEREREEEELKYLSNHISTMRSLDEKRNPNFLQALKMWETIDKNL